MDTWRLTEAEAQEAVDKWRDEDWSVRFLRLNRGHWEDIVPVIANAQARKLMKWLAAHMQFVAWQQDTSGARVILEVYWRHLQKEIDGDTS